VVREQPFDESAVVQVQLDRPQRAEAASVSGVKPAQTSGVAVDGKGVGTLQVVLTTGGKAVDYGQVRLSSWQDKQEYVQPVDSNGVAQFENLQIGEYGLAIENLPRTWVINRLAARDERLGGKPLRARVHSGVSVCEVILEAAALVEGDVMSADGWPVNDALIRISSLEGRERYLPSVHTPVVHGSYAASIHEGKWILECIAGTEAVGTGAVAKDSALRSTTAPAARVLVVQPNDRRRVDLQFERGHFALKARVLDDEDAPFSGLRVSLARVVELADASAELKPFLQGIAHAVTGVDGHFRFESLPAGKYQLQIEATGYNPTAPPGKSVVGSLQQPITVVVPDGIADDWTMTVPRARPVRIQGVVRTASGARPNATLILQAGPARARDRRQEVGLGPDGAFVFYVEGSERFALLELARDGHTELVPLEFSVDSGGPFHDISFPGHP
jgi:hypothetical protein